MFDRELMICGLRKQSHLLHNLIGQLGNKIDWSSTDSVLCQTKTNLVAKNLKKLRRIKDAYRLEKEWGGKCKARTEIRNQSQKTVLGCDREWKEWTIRTGLSPEAEYGVSRAGLYTDFT
jgi:hypothetical protein